MMCFYLSLYDLIVGMYNIGAMRGLPVKLSPEWLIRARRGDPIPSPDEPLVCSAAEHPGPSPLIVDVHDGLEVGIMLEGKAERHFQEFVLPGDPGDVWLCAMWEPHGRQVISSYSKNVVLQFIPEFLGEEMIGGKFWLSAFAVPPKDRPWIKTPKQRAEALAIGHQIKEEIEQQSHLWKDSIRLHLLRLLFILSRDWESAAPRIGAAPAGASLTRIMPALALLRDPRRPRLSLREAASACGISTSRFAVLFRELMGVTFAKFAMRARLAYAATRLISTELSVDAIAQEANFTDASHLYRHFLRQYGQTPGNYRQQPGKPGHGSTPKLKSVNE